MDALRDTLGHVKIADDLEGQVAAMAGALGFNTFALGYTNPVLSGRTFWIDRMPKCTWDVGSVAARDPVSSDVVATKVAKSIVWAEETYVKAGVPDLWELGKSIGLHSGIASVARPGGGRRMMLSMDRDGAFDGSPRHQQEQARQLSKFADLLAGAVVSLFDTQSLMIDDLTHAEREALKYVFGLGYTGAEIAERLNISFTHACWLLDSATEKIGAGSYVQASMIAARHGVLGAI